MNHKDTKTQRTAAALPPETNETARQVVDAAYTVHRKLGPGLSENVYEICLVHELVKRECAVKRQVNLPIEYDGIKLDGGVRLDMVVDGRVIVELKAVEALLPLHTAQLLTYLKLSGLRLGLLINFNVPVISEGIERRVL